MSSSGGGAASVSSWSVVVLTPSARRVTLKVTRHTTLLQVLEDVCVKVGLDPVEWDLTHYNRVLDLSQALCSSGVANNGSVEMVAATRVRREEEVRVGLQVPSGKRLVHSFPSQCTLWGVLEHWRVEVGAEQGEGQEEVCVFMRRELAGRAELEATTLRSLGLTHGQAVVRLLFRDKGADRGRQANVSSRISVPLKQNLSSGAKTAAAAAAEEPMDQGDDHQHHHHHQQQQQQQQQGHHSNQSSAGAGGGSGSRDSSAVVGTGSGGGPAKNNPHQQQKEVGPAPPAGAAVVSSGGGVVVRNAEQYSRPGDLHVIGSRDGVLYHGDDVLVDSSSLSGVDDDDDFFAVTVEDVRRMYRDLKQQRETLESSPLQLSSARELDRDACVLRLLHDHPETIVRVRFPDRFVLQGVFRTADTVAAVAEWLRTFLATPTTDFYLFVTPPRVVLRGESRLVEEGLVGMAIVYFGISSGSSSDGGGVGGGGGRLLKTELYAKVSAPDAALKLGRDRVANTRRNNKQQQQQQQTGTVVPVAGGSGAAQGAAAGVGGVAEGQQEPEPPYGRRAAGGGAAGAGAAGGETGGGGTGGVPKWFKLK